MLEKAIGLSHSLTFLHLYRKRFVAFALSMLRCVFTDCVNYSGLGALRAPPGGDPLPTADETHADEKRRQMANTGGWDQKPTIRQEVMFEITLAATSYFDIKLLLRVASRSTRAADLVSCHLRSDVGRRSPT